VSLETDAWVDQAYACNTPAVVPSEYPAPRPGFYRCSDCGRNHADGDRDTFNVSRYVNDVLHTMEGNAR
jgi:hypothetical protein